MSPLKTGKAKVKTYLKMKKHPEIILLTFITVILSGIGFCIDYRNIQEYGCVDLRNRVIGARLLNTEYSPYFFKWREGISDRFLDPSDNPNDKRNRVAVPPSVLIFQSLITGLDYRLIKKMWFLFQYLCLAYIIFTFMIMSKSFLRKNWVIIVGLLFIGGTPSWHLHIERGQIYIFYALLFCLAYQLYKSSIKFNELISGIVLGITVWLRPITILMSLPFAFNKRLKFLRGVFLGILIGTFITILLRQVPEWQSYFYSMKVCSNKQITQEISVKSNVRYPEIIEGVSNMARLCSFRGDNFSIQYLAFRFLKVGLNLNDLIIFFTISLLVLILILNKKLLATNSSNLFLLGFLMTILSEYFIPAPRYTYNYVQWIFPLLIIISEYNVIRSVVFPFLFIGLLLNMDVLQWIPGNLTLGEISLIFALLLALRFPSSNG